MKGSALAASFFVSVRMGRREESTNAFAAHGPVVQRPSIRPCQGRDRRFESGRDRGIELEEAATAKRRDLLPDVDLGEGRSRRNSG